MNILVPSINITIPDVALNAALHNALGIPLESPLTSEELATLTSFDARNQSITSLEGIQYCTGLIKADFSYNTIVDLSPLASCTELLELNVSYNMAVDISAFSTLTKLINLKIEALYRYNPRPLNYIDLSPLLSLTNLKSLDVSANEITDLTEISSLITLVDLDIGDNAISDIEIKKLTALKSMRVLYLSELPISDISFVKELKFLEGLFFNNDIYLTDISSLAELTGLKELQISNTSITDVSPLNGMASLQKLDVQGSPIVDMTSISTLSNLLYFNANNTPISNLDFCQSLEKLTNLYAEQTEISDLTPLLNCQELMLLYVEVTKVSDVSVISSLPKLIYFNCNQCRVIDLSAVVNNPVLQYVFASGNFLTSIEEYNNLQNNKTYAYLDTNFYYGKPNQKAFYTSTNALTLSVGSLAEIDFTVYTTTDGETYLPAEQHAVNFAGLSEMFVAGTPPETVTLSTRVADTGDGLVTKVTGDSVGAAALSISYLASKSKTAILPLITGETTIDVTVTQA